MLLNTNPIFYAALTSSKTADYAWDGNTGYSYAGSGSFSGNELLISQAATARLVWNCLIPQDKNLTFSCYITRTTASVYEYSFGAFNTAQPKYSCLCPSFAENYGLTAEWIANIVTSTYLAALNTKHFYTFSVIFNSANNFTFKLYVDGSLIYSNTVTNNNWLKFVSCYFSVGRNSDNNLIGKVSQCSCYELLSDAQVLQLYNNGGVPL